MEITALLEFVRKMEPAIAAFCPDKSTGMFEVSSIELAQLSTCMSGLPSARGARFTYAVSLQRHPKPRTTPHCRDLIYTCFSVQYLEFQRTVRRKKHLGRNEVELGGKLPLPVPSAGDCRDFTIRFRAHAMPFLSISFRTISERNSSIARR
jgi:hypothetical protein